MWLSFKTKSRFSPLLLVPVKTLWPRRPTKTTLKCPNFLQVCLYHPFSYFGRQWLKSRNVRAFDAPYSLWDKKKKNMPIGKHNYRRFQKCITWPCSVRSFLPNGQNVGNQLDLNFRIVKPASSQFSSIPTGTDNRRIKGLFIFLLGFFTKLNRSYLFIRDYTRI